MARKEVVSRTFTKYSVTVLCLDCETAEPSNQTFIVAKYDEKTTLKSLQKEHDTENLKLVKIVSVEQEEHLYAMPVEKFIELAEEMPLRGTCETCAVEEYVIDE